MTQKKVIRNKAGEIIFKDSTIKPTDDNKILNVNLQNDECNFFIKHKNADINIWFTNHGIVITAYQDKNETEIKRLEFESITKNKKIKIKLNKLLDGVQIQDRV